MKNTFRNLLKKYSTIFLPTVLSIPLGIVVGIFTTIFGKILLEISDFRNENIFKTIPFLPIAGLIIIFIYQKFGKGTQKGMGLVFAVEQKEEKKIPLRLVPLSIITTWITHLFGGSAGREGVAVQIGATIFNCVEDKLPSQYHNKILLTAGVAAGFSGLFQTPLAATLFALEVFVVGQIKWYALIPSLVASYSAYITSGFLGLEKFSFHLNEEISWNVNLIVKLIFIGMIFGIVGGVFAYLLNFFKKYMTKKIENPYFKIAILGFLLSVSLLLLHKGRYSGLGTNLISASFHSEIIYSYDWILKLIFTILTLSAGFNGGEVTPLFAIGASLGVILASFFSLPIAFVAALGYVAVFASATNTFLAPCVIGAEIFGYNYFAFFFVICSISYFCNGNQSIYNQKSK